MGKSAQVIDGEGVAGFHCVQRVRKLLIGNGLQAYRNTLVLQNIGWARGGAAWAKAEASFGKAGCSGGKIRPHQKQIVPEN